MLVTYRNRNNKKKRLISMQIYEIKKTFYSSYKVDAECSDYQSLGLTSEWER